MHKVDEISVNSLCCLINGGDNGYSTIVQSANKQLNFHYNLEVLPVMLILTLLS